ncbi:MAG: hypothetical protein Q4G51_05975 [Dermatophilus congolensis]|nr:hypothetical protein [Dermatophilus congolensis]
MHAMRKTKIRDLAAVLPPGLDAERKELQDIADALLATTGMT